MFVMENDSFGPSNISNGSHPAPAVSKAVRILDAVANGASASGVSGIARSTGLSKSTTHGLIRALLHEGFLVPGDGGRGYTLGPTLAQLGSQASELQLMRTVAPVLHDVAIDTGESGLFGRLRGDRVVILDKQEGTRPLNLSAPAGSSVPVMAGCLGKAYLATLSQGAAEAFLERHPLPRFTDRSITDEKAYREAVEDARRADYAVDRGEYLPGVSAACACFTWRNGMYFVWTVGIDAGYADGDLKVLGQRVSAATGTILQRLEEQPR